MRKQPPLEARLHRRVNKIGDVGLDFKITEDHEFLAYRKGLNRIYYEYVDGDKEVKKVDPTTLREDAPTAYHFPPDVIERVDWSGCPVVGQDPERVHGAPTFANTRLGLYVLFEHLAGGSTIAEFMDWFGFTDRKAIDTVLAYAQQYLRQHP